MFCASSVVLDEALQLLPLCLHERPVEEEEGNGLQTEEASDVAVEEGRKGAVHDAHAQEPSYGVSDAGHVSPTVPRHLAQEIDNDGEASCVEGLRVEAVQDLATALPGAALSARWHVLLIVLVLR